MQVRVIGHGMLTEDRSTLFRAMLGAQVRSAYPKNRSFSPGVVPSRAILVYAQSSPTRLPMNGHNNEVYGSFMTGFVLQWKVAAVRAPQHQ